MLCLILYVWWCAVAIEKTKLRAGEKLYQESLSGDLVAMATALSEGAEVNWSNPEQEGRTALIGSAIGVSDRVWCVKCVNMLCDWCVTVLYGRALCWRVSFCCRMVLTWISEINTDRAPYTLLPPTGILGINIADICVALNLHNVTGFRIELKKMCALWLVDADRCVCCLSEEPISTQLMKRETIRSVSL